MAASSSRVEAQAAEIEQLRAQLMEQLEGHRQLLQQMTAAQSQQQQQQPQDQHKQKQLLLQQQPPSMVGAGAAAPAPTWTLNALGLPAELPNNRKRAAESMESAESAGSAEADAGGGGGGEQGGKWVRRTRMLAALVLHAGVAQPGTHAAAAAAESRARFVARKLWAGKPLEYL